MPACAPDSVTVSLHLTVQSVTMYKAGTLGRDLRTGTFGLAPYGIPLNAEFTKLTDFYSAELWREGSISSPAIIRILPSVKVKMRIAICSC